MKVLLLSDETMCDNAGGLSQTLYNIFSFVEPDDLLCITSTASFRNRIPGSRYRDRYITYDFEIINTVKNRFSSYVNPLLEWLNFKYNFHFRSLKKVKRQIAQFNADVVVSCSNGPIGLYMHHKLLKGKKTKNVFPYFMDDWMYQTRAKWLNKKIDIWAKKILSDNPSWLMISTDLSDILQARYKVQPRSVLEIHNPVDLTNAPDVLPVEKKASYTLAYAGSLWPMHFDAFLVIAKSVKELQKVRKINLVVYTAESFWNWHEKTLTPLGVMYGGNIPYKGIHQKLAEADILILTSSFSKEWYTHSSGSIQTKITDYLKARRLIVSCGPGYSANHNFLKRNQCGVCIETNEETLVVNSLMHILDNINDYDSMISKGWNLLVEKFSFQRVHEKLKQFLSKSISTPHIIDSDIKQSIKQITGVFN